MSASQDYAWNKIMAAKHPDGLPSFGVAEGGLDWSYREGASNKHIYKAYAKKAEDEFMQVTKGKSSEELISDLKLQGKIYEEMQHMEGKLRQGAVRKIAELKSNREALVNKVSVGKSGDLQKLIAADKKKLEEVKKFQDANREFLNVAADIGLSLEELANQGSFKGEIEVEGEPNFVYALDSKLATASKNMEEYLNAAEKILANPSDPKTTVIKQEKTYSKGKETKKVKTRSTNFANAYLSGMQGYYTNVTGQIMEHALTIDLTAAIGDVVETFVNTGADKAEYRGVEITRKQDVVARNLSYNGETFDLGFSVKSVASKGGKSKYLDTSVGQLMNVYLDMAQIDKGILANAVVAHTSTKTYKKFFGAKYTLSSFLGAVSSNIAVGGVPGDRVGLVAYTYKILSVSQVLENYAVEMKKEIRWNIATGTAPKTDMVIGEKYDKEQDKMVDVTRSERALVSKGEISYAYSRALNMKLGRVNSVKVKIT